MVASQLISFADGKFHLDPNAAKLLKSLKGPVAVVVVCGRARQGKSFLLNTLVSKLTGSANGPKGFAVGNSTKPCTKGLWLWDTPVQRTAKDGTKYTLLLVDAEGIDAYDQSLDYSTQIFSLGVLLSSMLIYNQMGSIDESSINNLSSVCEFAKLIRQKSAAAGDHDLSAVSPAFLWLLRDFHLRLEEDGRKLTPKDYMEETLQESGGESKVQMRRSIKSLFPDRDCFALVRPLLDEMQLASMDKAPLNTLRPEFRQGLDRLTDLVLARAQPKQYNGQYINGSALAAFAQAYVDVINNGGVPQLSSTWQSVLSAENGRALEAALLQYARQAEAACAECGVDALDAAHEGALTAAVAAFYQQSLGDANERRGYEDKLRSQAAARFATLKAARLAQADAHITQLVAGGTSRLVALMSGDNPDLAKLDSELQAFLEEYETKAAGPSKYKRIAEFLVNMSRGVSDVAKRAGQRAAELGQKLAAALKDLAEVKARAAELEQKLALSQQAEGATRQQLAAAQAEEARLRKEVSARSEAAARAEAHGSSLQREVEELRARLERQQAALTSKEAAEAGLRRELAATQQDLAREAATSSARAQQLSALQADVAALRTDAAAAQSQAAGREKQLEADVARLKSELHHAHSRREGVEGQAAEMQASMAAQLQAREEALAQVRADLEAARVQARHTEQQVREARSELEALRRQADTAAERAQGVDEANQQQAAALRQQLADRDAALQQLQQQREEARRQLAAAQQAAAAAQGDQQSAVQQLQQQLAAAQNDRESAAQEVAAARQRLMQVQGEQAAAAQEAAALRQQLSAAEDHLRSAQQQFQAERASYEQRIEGLMRQPLAAAAAAPPPPPALPATGPVIIDEDEDMEDVEFEDAQDHAGEDGGPAAAAAAAATTKRRRDGRPAKKARVRPAPKEDASDTDAEEEEKGARKVAGRKRTAAGAAKTPARAAAAAAAGGAGAGAPGTPFSAEREVELVAPDSRGANTGGKGKRGARTPASPAPAPAAAAAAAGPRPELPDDVDKMTVNAIKNWLTEAGFEHRVAEAGARGAKKADWVKLVKEVCGP